MPDANIADLFARFWRELEKAYNNGDMPELKHVPAKSKIRAEVRAIIKSAGLEANGVLARWLVDNEHMVPNGKLGAMLLIAQEIDRWYAPLRFVQNWDPGEPETSGKDGKPRGLSADLIWAKRMLTQFGHLNERPLIDRVILKFPCWGKWSNPTEDTELPEGFPLFADFFDNLMTLPLQIEATDPDDAKALRKIDLSFKLFDENVMRKGLPEDVPRIGFAPIAQAFNDIEIAQPRTDDGMHWYDVRALDLGERAAEVIQKLCAKGAHIIVIPEMTVNPDTLERIKTAIGEYGPESKLRLVVLGTKVETAGSKPRNVAVLFNHRGLELGRQHKLHRWNLSRQQREKFGIDLPVLKDSDDLLREFITPGDEITIWEMAHLGRTSVLICEDLVRPEPGQWLQANPLLDWIFAPILDGSVELDRWVHKDCVNAAVAARCRVVVANSMPMTYRMIAALLGGLHPSCGIGLCVDVRGHDYHFERVAVPTATPATERIYEIIPWDLINWTQGSILRKNQL